MTKKQSIDRWTQVKEDVLNALNIVAEYQSLGLVVCGNDDDWIPCEVFGESDRSPSAQINVSHSSQRGRYHDFRSGLNVSFFDFCADVAKTHPSWLDALKHYAERTGVSLPKKHHPTKGVEFCEWNSALMDEWFGKKPPVTKDAFFAAGGQMLKVRGEPRIGLPIFGVRLDEEHPIGWIVWHRLGLKIKIKGGTEVKMQTLPGSESGFMGLSALKALPDAEIVWKAEGPGDMLAIESVIPAELREKHVAVTNSCGATERPKDWQIDLLAGKTIYVLADSDTAGKKGALRWAESLAAVAAEVRLVTLPYEQTDQKGKDVRDYFNDGHSYGELLELAAGSPTITGKVAAEPMEPDAKEEQFANILKELDLHIFGLRRDNAIVGYSGFTRRTFTISRITTYSLDDLVLDGGTIIDNKVVQADSDDLPRGTYSLPKVKRAISREASKRMIEGNRLHAQGIWRDPETGHIVIVGGNGQAAAWNGTTLEKIDLPFYGGLQLDFNSTTESFYDFDALKDALENFNPKKACEKFERLQALAIQWEWRKIGNLSKPHLSMMFSGLACSTFMQTVFNWRPAIYITGAAQSGKSELLKLLGHFFGKLGTLQTKPTEAAIRQIIGNSSVALIIDELENDRNRRGLLELLRTSGNGNQITRGGKNGIATSYGLRHIPWLASIELDLTSIADASRFLVFELDRPKFDLEAPRKRLDIPVEELREIGQLITTAMIFYANRIRERAIEFSGLAIGSHGMRTVECYAAPVATIETIYAAADMEFDGVEFLRNTLDEHDSVEDAAVEDHDQLIEDIMNYPIYVNGYGEFTVNQIIHEIRKDEFPYLNKPEYIAALERVGIITEFMDYVSHKNQIFMITSRLSQNVTSRIKKWNEKNICQILKRIPSSKYEQKKIKGQAHRGVWVLLEGAENGGF